MVINKTDLHHRRSARPFLPFLAKWESISSALNRRYRRRCGRHVRRERRCEYKRQLRCDIQWSFTRIPRLHTCVHIRYIWLMIAEVLWYSPQSTPTSVTPSSKADHLFRIYRVKEQMDRFRVPGWKIMFVTLSELPFDCSRFVFRVTVCVLKMWDESAIVAIAASQLFSPVIKKGWFIIKWTTTSPKRMSTSAAPRCFTDVLDRRSGYG